MHTWHQVVADHGSFVTSRGWPWQRNCVDRVTVWTWSQSRAVCALKRS